MNSVHTAHRTQCTSIQELGLLGWGNVQQGKSSNKKKILLANLTLEDICTIFLSETTHPITHPRRPKY